MTAGLVSFSRGENPLRADKLNSGFSERLLRSGDAMTGPLLLTRDPVLPFEASTKQYIDALVSTALSGFLSITGGTLTGMLTLFADPTLPLHAATKRYVDNTLTNGYLPLVGGTLTGNLTIGVNATNGPELRINGAVGNTRAVTYYSGGIVRWRAYADGAAEGGSNAGSDFRLDRWSDAGGFLGNAIIITRSTGVATFSASPIAPTPATADNSTKLATTAYVLAQLTAAGAITEAPLDGQSYGRTSANWAAVLPLTGGTLTNAGGPPAILTIVGTGGSGAGILLTGNGATTPSKYLRAYNGTFQVINNAFSAAIFTLSDAGALTIPGIITIGGNAVTSPALQINGAANTDKQVIFYSAGAGRWLIAVSNTFSAESGGNAGGDLAFGRYNDAGAYIATTMSINRATGLVTMNAGLSVVGSISATTSVTAGTTGGSFPSFVLNGVHDTNRQFIYQTNGSLRWLLQASGAGGETGSNAGSDFVINRYSDAGLFLGASLSISRQTGVVTLDSTLNSNGRVTGAIGVFCGASAQFGMSQDATYQYDNWTSQWQNRFGIATGVRQWTDPTFVALMTLGASGIFTVANNAYKPGGGVWGDSSDARIKDVRGDYTHGLDEIVQLQPRTFRYRGNERLISVAPRLRDAPDDALMPEPDPSPHSLVLEQDFVGLVAQDVEDVFPEMVTQVEGLIDEQRVSDLRVLDVSPLLFAMINAFKQVNARLRALENA